MADEQALPEGIGSLSDLLTEVREKMPSLAEYTKETAEIQGITFHFKPMAALRAWKLGEHVRVHCGGFLGYLVQSVQDGNIDLPVVLGALGTMKTPVIEAALDMVLPTIEFEAVDGSKHSLSSKDRFDAAFRGKAPSQKAVGIYQVLFHALGRNLIPPLPESDTSS